MTLYHEIKTLHVAIAAIILGGGLAIFAPWIYKPAKKLLSLECTILVRTQRYAWLIITPLCFVQLVLGFFIISMKQYPWQLWTVGAMLCFLLSMVAWFAALLALNEFLSTWQDKYLRRLRVCLSMALCIIVIGIYFMASRVVFFPFPHAAPLVSSPDVPRLVSSPHVPRLVRGIQS